MTGLVVRGARAGDEDALFAMLRAFAEFERLTHTFRLTPEIIRRHFLGEHRRVHCAVAEMDGTLAGAMIWFDGYGTFSAAPVIFLEDIFVRPEFRRRGIATAFLKHLARRAVAEGAARIHWLVLDWNTAAIQFYESVGAPVAKEWRVCDLSGEALTALAKA